jgi:thioredoxin reductase
MKRHEVIIIGGGPAGVAAAIQLMRGGLEPLLFERDRIGGLLRDAHFVENYPGFPDGIEGVALADRLAAHLERAGVDVVHEEVVRIDRANGAFSIRTAADETGDGGALTADRIVIASGTAPNVLRGVMIFGDAVERVHYGVRELAAVRGAKIAVIGGGDAAFDYALNCSGRNDVAILHRGDRPRCIPVLEERCAVNRRVTYHANTTVEEIIPDGNGVILKIVRGPKNKKDTITADHVIVAIGRAPHLDFIHNGIGGRVEELRTEGLLYLVGDVVNGRHRQAAISAGDGLRAAMEILAGSPQGAAGRV